MLKQLLLSAAVVAMTFSASAETKVLWSADDPEAGELATWGQPLLSLTPEQSSELKVGDVLTFTVVSVDSENGWPQVAVFEGGIGWPPVANVGVGGKGSYPYVAEFPVAGPLADILDKGLDFKGDGAYVSEIALITSDKVYDPNTVWFGPKVCNWGDPVSLGSDVFADVAPGYKIVVEYDTAAPEHTLQFLFGGWSGLNLPTYEAWKIPFMTIDEEAGTITVELVKGLDKFEWEVEDEVQEFDVFALLKTGGLIMQGPCTVNAVLYIQASDSGVEEANQAAYDAVIAEIDDATEEYEVILNMLMAEYPDYDFSEWIAIIGGALEEARTGAAQALASANEDGEEFNFPFDAEYIEEMIYMMIEDVETSDLRAANQAAYDDIIAQIDYLTDKFMATVAQLKEENPDYDFSEWMAIIGGALEEARTGAAQALAAANEDGEEFNFPFDAEYIDAMINEMIEVVKTSGIESIENAVAEGSATIYTLDGRKLTAPERGAVNIIVTPTSTSKVYIRK